MDFYPVAIEKLIEEFAKLQDVIKESFEDVLKKYPHAKISVDIIF